MKQRLSAASVRLLKSHGAVGSPGVEPTAPDETPRPSEQPDGLRGSGSGVGGGGGGLS